MESATMIPTLLLVAIALISLIYSGHAFQSAPPSTTIQQDQTQHLHSCSSRRECIASLLSATIGAKVVLLPQPAVAITDETSGVLLNYNGVYTDPKHPKGYRILIGNSKSAILKLQDEPNGQVYNLPVQVKAAEGEVQQFVIDFSPKGGPADIVGDFAKDREGIPIITFPDGNSWKKRETGPIGVYRNGKDPKIRCVIRQFKGPELTVNIMNIGDGTTTTTMRAKAENPTILFEFPGGDPVPGVVNLKKKTISFEDGNVWTKF